MFDTDPSFDAGASVRIRNLTRRFGESAVLSRLDLDIAPGEFLAIVGRSGCGKSTLLRLLAGLDLPDGGSIDLDGAMPAAGSPAVRIMFQEPRLLPWATVLDNAALGAPPGVPGSVARDAAAAALEEVRLPGRGGDWPAALSGGQKSRVALARALAGRPRLLLLDEPLGALDALTRLEMQRLILSVKDADRFTAVLVTHDVAEAVALADRVIVLGGGGILHEERILRPQPRPPADPALSEIEARLLAVLMDP